MRRLALALAVLALAGPAPALAAGVRSCPNIVFGPVEKPEERTSVFSANETTDILVGVLLPGDLTGEHLLELRFLTPQGDHYKTMAVPVSPRGGERVVAGHARPVKAQVPRRVRQGREAFFRVDQPFPVGGTLIQASSLYGPWRVEVSLDGQPLPCRHGVFTINP